MDPFDAGVIEKRSGALEGFRVAVNAQNPLDGWEPLEHCTGMAAESEGSIGKDATPIGESQIEDG